MTRFQTCLNEYLCKNDMSIKKFCEVYKVSRNNTYRLINGDGMPRVDMAIKLSRVFNKSVEEIWG